MKNLKNKLIILIVIAGFLQSCSDYLDQTNPNEASTDTYWSDLEESEASLTGVYGGMLDTFIGNAWSEALRSDLGIHSLLRLNTPRPNPRITPKSKESPSLITKLSSSPANNCCDVFKLRSTIIPNCGPLSR